MPPRIFDTLKIIAIAILVGLTISSCGGAVAVLPEPQPELEPEPQPPSPPSQSTAFSQQLMASQADAMWCIAQGKDKNIVLLRCDAEKVAQKWSYTPEDKRLVNTLDGGCLTAIADRLVVEPCSGSPQQQWHYQNAQFSQLGYVIDFDMGGMRVILYPGHGGANQQWVVPSAARAFIDANNTVQTDFPLPLDYEQNIAIKIDELKDSLNRLTPLNQPLPYPRDVSDYPGSVAADARPVSQTIKVDRDFYEPGHAGWYASKNWISTGLYAPAGKIIELNVQTDEIVNTAGLYVIINVHTDKLGVNTHNVVNAGQLKRYGNLSMRIPLKPGHNRLRSQYDGQIIIESVTSVAQQVDVTINHAVVAPHFKLGRDSQADWLAMLKRPAPWGVLEGEHVYLDMSAQSLHKISDPEALLSAFDKVVMLIRTLAGFDQQSGVHRASTVKQRLVEDIQISVGFAHAQYPIMTSPGWELFSLESIAKNGWGNWHEIGHNHQQFCLWSQDFGVESTVNLFSLYVQQALVGTSRIIEDKRYTSAIEKLANTQNFDFQRDADVWDKLVFLMQIVHAYPQQGFEIYRQLNRRFREMEAAEQGRICGSSFASFDATFELLSDIVGEDLGRHFRTWGVPVSHEIYQKVANKYSSPAVDISAINPES